MWDKLRKLGLLKKSSSPPLAVSINDLNLSFARVSTGEILPIDDAAERHLPQYNARELVLQLVTADQAEQVVRSSKSNATGADGLCLKMIKPLLPLLIGFLVTLFNRSITDC